MIFLHVPKTAGTTLTDILARQYPAKTTFLIGGPGRPTLEDFEALDARERGRLTCLAGHVPFGVHRLLSQPARYVTMLRDPVDRLVSQYYYAREEPGSPMHERVVSEKLDLEDFVRCRPSNMQVRFLSGASRGVTITREMLERARRNLEEHFVAFGLVERFDDSLLLIARALGWRNLYYMSRNVTRERPARSRLPASTVAMIEEHDGLDRELYRFASEAFEPMLRAHGVRAADVIRFKVLNRLHSLAVAASHKARTARRMVRTWRRAAALRNP